MSQTRDNSGRFRRPAGQQLEGPGKRSYAERVDAAFRRETPVGVSTSARLRHMAGVKLVRDFAPTPRPPRR